MTDQMKNTNKRRRSFLWQRKRCLTAELSQSAIAAEEPLQDQQQDAQPWYRPGLLKVGDGVRSRALAFPEANGTVIWPRYSVEEALSARRAAA